MATLKKRNNRLESVLKSAVVLVLIVLLAQTVLGGRESFLGRGIAAAISPFMRLGAAIHRTSETVWLGVFHADSLESENEALREELARVRLGEARDRSTEALAYVAQEVSTHIPDGTFDLIPVSVLATPPPTGRQVAWVSGGKDKGLEPAMVVLGPQGIVGEVEAVYEHTALIELVTDTRAAWGAEVDGRSLPALLRGTGDPFFLELHFDRTAVDVKLQDRVVSSGMAGSAAPGGIEFGIVQEVRLSKAGEPVAIVRLAADPGKLRTFFVLPMTRIPFKNLDKR